MSAAPRPRRSVLYMPGSNARALEKARDLPADGLILDLEDSVAPAAKDQAREQVVAAVAAGGFGDREVLVRINGLDTSWGANDITALAASGANGIVLPKVERAGQITDAVAALDAAGAPADLPIWIMAETPRGVLDLDAIAASTPRLGAVVMGTQDLAKALRLNSGGDRAGLVAYLSHCVLAARAHGVDILDGIHIELNDAAGFQAACEQGRKLGFDGKTLIHPRQIAAANQVFGVSDNEVAWAEKILAAWDEAQQAGQGITVVQDKLVEQLHVDDARRILALRDAISSRSGEQQA